MEEVIDLDGTHATLSRRGGAAMPPQPLAATVRGGAVDLKRVVDAYETQVSVVDAQAAKTTYAIRRLADMYHGGYLTLKDTISYMCALDVTVNAPGEAGEFILQARRELILGFIDHVQAAIQVGSRNVGVEIARSLHPEPAAPPKRGLLYRLIFGKDGHLPAE